MPVTPAPVAHPATKTMSTAHRTSRMMPSALGFLAHTFDDVHGVSGGVRAERAQAAHRRYHGQAEGVDPVIRGRQRQADREARGGQRIEGGDEGEAEVLEVHAVPPCWIS